MSYEFDAATHWHVLLAEYDWAIETSQNVVISNYLLDRMRAVAKENE